MHYVTGRYIMNAIQLAILFREWLLFKILNYKTVYTTLACTFFCNGSFGSDIYFLTFLQYALSHCLSLHLLSWCIGYCNGSFDSDNYFLQCALLHCLYTFYCDQQWQILQWQPCATEIQLWLFVAKQKIFHRHTSHLIFTAFQISTAFQIFHRHTSTGVNKQHRHATPEVNKKHRHT